MKAKFTSGEWVHQVTGGEREGVRLGEVGWAEVRGGPFDTRCANARLIAAAPRLYRALEELVRISSRGFDLASLPATAPRRLAVESARAALAQADGGEG